MRIDRTLLIAGLALFLVGLLSGFAVPLMVNPRAGLAAHLEGVMNGTFLLVVALAWPHLVFTPRAATITRWLLVLGTWANLLGTQLSAILGTSEMTPIAGAGHAGAPWAEQLVNGLLIFTGITMVPALVLLLWGAVRTRPH